MVLQKKTLARKPSTTPLPRAALQALIDGHAQRGPIELHAPLTKLKIRETEAFWKQFCSHMSYGDPDVALKEIATTPSIIVGYLLWRQNRSTFKGHRRNTVRHWWKLLSQLYLFKFRVPTSLEARKAVSEVLRPGGYLVLKCCLNTDSKERPVVTSDDYYDILFTLHTAPLKQLYMRNERQRFRLWLYEHVAGYTGTRPGPLVSRRQDAVALEALQEDDEFATEYNDNEVLRYKHCTLTLFPGEAGDEFGTWVLEIQLRRIKGGVGEGREPVTYPLFATPCLAQCPIMSFVTQAFYDGAIKSQKLLTPEQFWTLKIPSHKKTLQLKWKDSMQETPIFRNDDGTNLRYDQLRDCLVRLGKAANYPEVLTTYCTRRGFVNAIHGKVTSAQQNQAMNHTTTVFERHYLAGRLASDVQNTFLGLPTQEKLVKVFSSMQRSQDRARPTRLVVEELQQAYKSSEIIQELHEKRVQATARCQKSFGSITRSRGSPEFEVYLKACRDLQGLRRKTAADALEAKQQQYDDSTDDVDNQIDNIPDTQPEHTAEGTVVHPLRKRLSTILFASELPQAGTQEDINRRILAMNDLLALCTLEHAPDNPSTVNRESSTAGDDDEEWAGFSSEEEEDEDEQQDKKDTLEQQTFEISFATKRDEHRLTDLSGVPDIITIRPVASPHCAGRVKEDEKVIDHMHRSPDPAPETETKVGELAALPGPVCENPSCASKTSISWTKTPDGLLCNACRQYRTKHQGRLRPAPSLRMTSLRGPGLRRRCVNALCGASSASSTSSGYQANCGWLCEPCAAYFLKRGCLPPRPLGTAQSLRKRDLRDVSVDTSSDTGNIPTTDLMAPAYLHLNIHTSLLGQPATASVLLSEPTPPLTPCKSSIASSSTSQSASWLDASMPQMENRRAGFPFTESLSSTRQTIPGLQRITFDPDPELGHSPAFSDLDEESMDFEWCLK